MRKNTKSFKNLLEYYGFTKRDEKKYPVVSGILKSLTPERIEREIKAIQRIKLPPELEKWVKEYEKVGERKEFIWKWLYKMNKISSFFEISKSQSYLLYKIKTLFNMLIILIDDVAEKNKDVLLKEILKVPVEKNFINFRYLSSEDRRYLNFTIKVWREIEKILNKFPCNKKYQVIFDFDIRQFISEVIYSNLIYKDPFLMNELEYWTYLPQGMQIIIDFDLDLIESNKNFNKEELGLAREIVLIFQQMARIGNWVSTWEREAKSKDFTAILFPLAKRYDLISCKDLIEASDKISEKIRRERIEKELLGEWEVRYKKVKAFSKINLLDIGQNLRKFEYLLQMHLISRGLK